MTTMATLTLPLAQLAAGDVLIAMDGAELPARREIEGTRREDGALRMINPIGPTEWWLYPDQAEAWTVERPDPEPPVEVAPKPRPVLHRTIAGLPLVSHTPGVWATEDGRYELRKDLEWYLCDAPHPVRTKGRSGYLCPGEQEHAREEWGAWDLDRDDWAAGVDAAPTLTEVAGDLARVLAKAAARKAAEEAAAAASARVEGEPTDRLLGQLATAVPRMRTWTKAERVNGRWTAQQSLTPPRSQLAEDPQVGDIVLTPSGDYYRAAVVTGVGPKRLRVAYTTPHSVEEARRYGHGLTVTRPYVSRSATYFVPASSSWLPQLPGGTS